MVNHYPWSDETPTGEEAAEVLWDFTRNPLSHTLGVGKSRTLFPGMPGNELPVSLSKAESGLSADAVAELTCNIVRPAWVGPAITTEAAGYVVNVEALSWGVHQMLRHLFADASEARPADETARHLLSR